MNASNKDGNNKERWTWTRGQVAEALGISVTSVRRMEGVELHPAIDERNGQRLVDPEAVRALAEKREATRAASGAGGQADSSAERRSVEAREIAATVFEELDAGVGLTEIVTRHRLPPTAVRELCGLWKELKLLDVNLPSVPAAVAKLEEQVADIFEQLAALTQVIGEVQATLAATPTAGLHTEFECGECGSQGNLGVKVECTNCRDSRVWGWFPPEEEDKGDSGSGVALHPEFQKMLEE